MKYINLFTLALFSIILFNMPLYADWSIVATYPVPEGASGLAYDGTNLYCGIYGVNGGEVYQIDPATGDYQLIFTGPQEDTYGLTYDSEYLWLTDHPGSSGDPAIAIQLDFNGNLISQFDLPTHYMSGIAYDNGDFWVSAYYNPDGQIYKVDSQGTILQQFAAPDNQPWDLCLENDYLWMADYWGDALYKIDPTNGSLIESNPSEGADPAGIVFDGEYLWYCDNGQGSNQDYLYKVNLAGSGTAEIQLGFEEYDFDDIIIGTFATVDLPISNPGTTNLEIRHLSFTLPQYSAIFQPPHVIEPGQTGYLTLLFTPDDWGFFPATLTIESNDPVNPSVEVSLNGYGIYEDAEIHITDDDIEFPNIRVTAYSARDIEILNSGAEELIIDQIDFSDNNHFSIDETMLLPLTLSTRDSTIIRVWFHADDTGTFDCVMNIFNNDSDENPYPVQLSATAVIYSTDVGTELWSYQTNDDYDKVVAMQNFVDLTGDGVAEVLVADDDYGIHCLNGNSSGTADLIWYFSSAIQAIGYGSIYQEQGLTVASDLNGDGIEDVIAGTAWGSRAVFAIDGSNGEILWSFDSHQIGDGGWIYQVDASEDYNGDGVHDVLAAAGDDIAGTGPRGIFLLNGLDGQQIWYKLLYEAQSAVSSIDDIDDDGIPEVIAAGSVNSGTTMIRALRGSNGNFLWGHDSGSSTVYAITTIMDVDGDDLEDVCYGTFDGNIIARTSLNGELWQYSFGSALVTRIAKATNIAGDEFIIPSLLGTNNFPLINSSTGQALWTYNAGAYILDSSPVNDVDGDDHFDILLGTLADQFILLSGTDGSPIFSYSHSDPIDQTLGIDDIDGSGTPEILFGDRDGYVKCFSTGVDLTSIKHENVVDKVPENVFITNYPNPFNPKTTIQFGLGQASHINLAIYDLSGKLVKMVVNDEKEAGYHSVVWEGNDERGKSVASGIYFYRIEVGGDYQEVKQMVLLK